MDRVDHLILAGSNRIAARVDYQVCGRCGFRLMRVETTIIEDQQLIGYECPICEQFDHDISRKSDTSMRLEQKLQYFDAWLSTHGLNRDVLENHYHLSADQFFDNDY